MPKAVAPSFLSMLRMAQAVPGAVWVLGRERLRLIHYVCLCVSFVSAEHLNITSIGPTRLVSHVKTARVTSSSVVSQTGVIKTAPQTCAGLKKELLHNAHCRIMRVASVSTWTFWARLNSFQEDLCL